MRINANFPATRILSEDVRLVPIPAPGTSKNALGYHGVPIDVEGDLNKEPVVKLADYGIVTQSAYRRPIAPYYRAFASSFADVWLRESAAERLAFVNTLLDPYDAEVVALDGLRPIELQQELWQHFIAKGREALVNPSEADLVEFAGTYCSDPRGFKPDDPTTWPVHCTGGAIDLVLRSKKPPFGELFFGSIFDDADAISFTRHFENLDLKSSTAEEARRNRRLLLHPMAAAGFVNYGREFWHYDFGTQMWVANNSGSHTCDHAVYGRFPTEQARLLPATDICRVGVA